MNPTLTEKQMRSALELLGSKLKKPTRLIIGGGGAMLLAHHFPLITTDINGIPDSGATVQEFEPLILAVAKELGLSSDWLNPYFATFTHVLPKEYGERLVQVLKLKNLQVDALSKEDLLIMKCFAGRQKDVAHARVLIQKGADTDLVEGHIESLKKLKIPGAEKALDFLDELIS